MGTRDLIDLVVLGAIWGASFLFMRIAVPEFGAIPLIAARVGIAAVFLLAVLSRRSGLRDLHRNAARLALLGAINSAIPFSLFAFAVLSVTAGFASVLNATTPLFGALVAFVWLRDRPAPIRIAGLIVGFTGVLVLVWGRLSVKDDGSGALAVVAGLTAALLYGIAANYTKRQLGGVDSLVIATGSLVAATVFLVPLAVLYWPPAQPSFTSWVSAALLAIICTGIAYILYFRLLNRVGPSKTLAVTYLIPVFGVLWGRLFLDEPVTASMIVGCSVILLGITLANGILPGARGPAATPATANAYTDQRG
jgi:drug/metabolite transporter (DMT)-like permease